MTTGIVDVQRPARRSFLKGVGTAAALALTIGFEWGGSPRRAAAAEAAGGTFAPTAFRGGGADDRGTVIAKRVGGGGGASPGMATIVAEEPAADGSKTRVESAPADAKRYANLAF